MNTISLDFWKKRLYFLSGASVTLLLVALADLSQHWKAPSKVIFVDGWFGIWLALLIANLVSGLVLLAFPRWREIPFQQRLQQAMGYFGLAWLVLLAFSLRLTTHLPAAFHYAVFGSGVVLVCAASFVYWKTHRLEEIFP